MLRLLTLLISLFLLPSRALSVPLAAQDLSTLPSSNPLPTIEVQFNRSTNTPTSLKASSSLSPRASGYVQCFAPPSSITITDAFFLHLSLLWSSETFELGRAECRHAYYGTAMAQICGTGQTGKARASMMEWAGWQLEIMQGCMYDGKNQEGGMWPDGRDLSVMLVSEGPL
jgi:hypothetical protein